MISTILQMLGEKFTLQAGQYEARHKMSYQGAKVDKNGVINIKALAGFQLTKAYLADEALAGLSEELKQELQLAKQYWQNFHNIREMKNLIAGLSGQYIETGTGGDPIRNPDAVPSGTNLVGFNPAKVPSQEAYLAGKELVEKTIQDYVKKHGRYPEKLAFSLWSLETMRHHGVLESQILAAMGVKPVWNRQGQVTGSEIIPMKELKRPRVDVVVSATGLYRDAFPSVMLWMAKAIDEVAKLKEDNNFLHRHFLATKKQLIEQGQSEEEASYLSSIRIFSNETGRYGTGLASRVGNSGSWENDNEMAENYLNKMGYAYGRDEKRWSENVGPLALYNKALSGVNAVVFSRSSNLYALLTNDDPYQYFGGIALAVRHIDGKTPEMYVANLRQADNTKMQTMEHFLNQEMRSRYFHPRWIEAMQAEGYAGALTMLDRVNNVWGWQVMTPDAIRDDHWQEFFEVYVEDKYQLDMENFFKKNSPEAMAQIMERMLEAERKKYWKTDQKTLKTLVEKYVELANQYDIQSQNEKFKDYVNQSAQGFGLATLAAPTPANAASNASAKAAASQQVTGQTLKKVEFKEQETDYRLWYLVLLILALGAASPYFPECKCRSIKL